MTFTKMEHVRWIATPQYPDPWLTEEEEARLKAVFKRATESLIEECDKFLEDSLK